MDIIDAHFHWYPAPVEQALNRVHSTTYQHSLIWSDLEIQLTRMEELGHSISVIASTGPFTGLFTSCGLNESLEVTRLFNELVSEQTKKHPGRVWGTCVLPLQSTDVAISELEDAATRLGLIGVNIPAQFGERETLDAPRLEPLYQRIEELGLPVIIHPNDETFREAFGDYNGALHLGLGRVVDVSVAGLRLIVSGIMQRHPRLKVLITHTGGVLPYQAGRLDKNLAGIPLDRSPTGFLRQMYTDTVSPHALGIRFALDFFGADQVLYGSDFPCWDPSEALAILHSLKLDERTVEKLFVANARRLFGLDVPAPRAHRAETATLAG